MNILILSALNFWSGGTREAGAPSFIRTIQAYCKAGHKIYLITPEIETLKYIGDNLHPWVVLKNTSFLHKTRVLRVIKYAILFPLAAFLQYLRLARRLDIDLIYGYEIHGILAGYLVKKIIHKPLVSRFQGTVLYPLVLQKSTTLEKLLKFDHYLGFKVPAELAIMTNDGTYGNLVLERLNHTLAKNTYFWINGVDQLSSTNSQKNIRLEMGLDDSTIILMTMSRLVKWKRVDRAIQALPAIIEKYPKVELIILGDGEEKEPLEHLTKILGIERHVHFLGWIDQSKVSEYLHCADIYLSLYDLSNLGNPLLEALRNGKPVITIKNGDTGSIIHNDYNGILLNSGSKEEVSAAVLDLIFNPEKRVNIARGARNYAEGNLWDWNTRLERELVVVTELVQREY